MANTSVAVYTCTCVHVPPAVCTCRHQHVDQVKDQSKPALHNLSTNPDQSINQLINYSTVTKQKMGSKNQSTHLPLR